MAEIERDDKGAIKKVTYADSSGYAAEIEAPAAGDTRVRVWTRNKSGSGSPMDFERDEAKRFAHDLIDLAGGDN